ncbi:MAG: hypothetical protein JNM27_22895 [Leptospirales bacterium]|nr:hypothetical protein [Leptospirales bacterium]
MRGLYVYVVGALLAHILLILPVPAFAQTADQMAPDASNLAQANTQNPTQNTTPAPAESTLPMPLDRPVTQEAKRRAAIAKERDKEAESAYRYAVQIHGDGYNERSLELLRDFLVRFPGHERTYFVRMEQADILREMGETLEAANLDLETCRLFQNQERGGNLCLRAARLLKRSGDHDRAVAVLKETIRRYPATSLARVADVELNLISETKPAPALLSDDSKTPETPKREDREKEETLPLDEMPGDGVFDANPP